MKSLMQLLLCVLADAGRWCRTSTSRDLKTITSRVEHEGLSFLTIALPSFCQDFERSLDEGIVAPSRFLGFKKRGRLPVFLRGFTELVFDTRSGVLLENPDVHAIFAVRQITLLYKKILLPCSKERVGRAYSRFIECESEVRLADQTLSSFRYERFREYSRLLWGAVLQDVQSLVQNVQIVPKHGPGATADRVVGNAKFTIRRWNERLEPFFPSDAFAVPNVGFLEDLDAVEFLEPDAEIPVRVITVPKTLKTPRIIAIEPCHVQYVQQALLEVIVPALESHRWTSGSVNFTDQKINQQLALQASSDQRLSTIDMKDASDKVSNRLVVAMLESVPDLSGAIQACRSLRADVPGHGVTPLSKFASMGSALCFPIEAMVFYTILLIAWHEHQGCRLSEKSLLRAKSDVRVYGDDIIIPTELVPIAVRELEAYGLTVNKHKTFSTGKFRESCGVDAFAGTPVTPVYVRRTLPTSRRDTSEMLSTISLANQFYFAGYWETCTWLRNYTERFATVPYVSDTSPVHGWLSYKYAYEIQSWDPHLHAPRVKGVVTRVKSRASKLTGYGALLKFFIKRGEEPLHDVKHLERHGRPESVDIMIRWAQPY